MQLNTVLQDRYTVTDRIAVGSQATVWRCLDTANNTFVAIKHASDPQQWPNARRESVLLRLLNLPGVVPIVDEWVDPSGWFVVMPLLPGTPFPANRDWSDIQPLIQGILTTLAAMHARGIVHADLKPENILVDGNTTTLIDLGFAVDRQAAEDISGFTPTYAAPELWFGEQATGTADVFALARVAVGALGVDVPLAANPRASHTQLLNQVNRLDMPAADREMLKDMLSWQPTDRPTAAELTARLGQDASQQFEIRARHRFDHTPEDMRAILAANSVSLTWLLSSGMGRQEGSAVYFTREEVSRLELAMAPRTYEQDAPPLHAVDSADVDTVLAWCHESVARPEKLRWALPLARWAVGHTQATNSTRTGDALALFTCLAVHSEQATAMHDAALAVDRAARSPVATQCADTLRAAIDVRIQGRLDSSTASALNDSTPRHSVLGRCMTLIKVWTMRSDMGALRIWLEQELETLEDREAIGRRLTWLSIVAYKQQDYDAGLAAIGRKRKMGCEVTLVDLGNEANLVLESGAHERAAELARSIRWQAAAMRLAHIEVRVVVLERNAQYRMDALDRPATSIVLDASIVSTRLGALLALNEAAVAFRHHSEEAEPLAVQAQLLATECRAAQVVKLAKVLRAAVTQDTHLALAVAHSIKACESGALVVQILGLCNFAGANIPRSDIEDRIQSPKSEWSLRREILSISECLTQTSPIRVRDDSGPIR